MAVAGGAGRVAVATEAMQQQDGVAALSIELPPALPGQGDRAEALTRFQPQGLVAEGSAEQTLADGIPLPPAAMAATDCGGGHRS